MPNGEPYGQPNGTSNSESNDASNDLSTSEPLDQRNGERSYANGVEQSECGYYHDGRQ